MKAIIVSGGTSPSKELLMRECENSNFIIGVDKGIEYLHRYGINPNIIVGDFDSVDTNVLEEVLKKHIELIKFPSEKDDTDTQIAIDKCFQLKVEEIVMLGCLGSRMDHTLANIGLLYKCLQAGKRAYIKDDNNVIFMINRSMSLKGNCGDYISLMAFGGPVEGLSIKGAKYPLSHHDLNPWDNRTVSNEFLTEDINITFKSGSILVLYCKD